MKKSLMLLVFIMSAIFLVGCGDVKTDAKTDAVLPQQYFKEANNSYFENYFDEEINFAFYDYDLESETGVAEVTVEFPADLSMVDFQYMKLYYDHKELKDLDFEYEISPNGENTTLKLEIHSYIEGLDYITGICNDEKVDFYVGNFKFEQFDYADGQNDAVLRYLHSTYAQNQMDLSLVIDPKPTEGKIFVPAQMFVDNYIEYITKTFDKGENQTDISLILNRQKLIDDGIKRLSYQTWIGVDNEYTTIKTLGKTTEFYDVNDQW